MELVKNIFFNTDKLIEKSKVKISYTGKFFQDGSEKVYAHYGFGVQWNNICDVEMIKTELGFQTEIELLDGETFNLCFKNEKNQWDNNNNQNYIFDIEKPANGLMVLENEPMAIGTNRKLRKTYLWNKKIKLAIYKVIIYLPKIISGNYKKNYGKKIDSNV